MPSLRSTIWKISIATTQGQNVDMFPQTDKTSGPIPANGQNEKYRPDIEVSLSFHVECVVLMSRVKK
jgi:hypothetical protein